MDSEDDHERKAQRMKLESDLEMTSERLDELVQGVWNVTVWRWLVSLACFQSTKTSYMAHLQHLMQWM